MPQRVSREGLIKFAPVLVLLALIVLFSLINPNFLSLRNAGRIAIAATPALMVAVGVTFIILMGSIDLAMEGTVAVAAVVFGYVFIWAGGTLAEGWWAIPLALAVGAAMGLVNGLAHVRLRIPSFMASLALGFVGIGLSLVMTGGDRIRVEDEAFRTLLKVRWLGFPVMCYVALFFLLVAWFIQSRTTIGRNFYAVGGGEDLAQASGLNVGRVRVIGFTLAGIFYAIGAILAVARIGIAETQTGLAQFMFVSITAVVVGGTALWGGVGGVWNTLVGVLIVFTISNGMTVIGLPDYLQDGILGLLVIIAVVLSTDRRAIAFVK